MSESTPFIDSAQSISSPTAFIRHRFISFLTFLLICMIIILLATRHNRFYSQYFSQYDYGKIIWNLANVSTANSDLAVEESLVVGMLNGTTNILSATTATTLMRAAMLTTTPPRIVHSATLTTAQSSLVTTKTTMPPAALTPATIINDTQAMVTPGTQKYITAAFSATCIGLGISNRLYEFISLYGIARTLDRVPYANLMNDCLLSKMKEMALYFPKVALAIELKVISKEMTTEVDFANEKCCVYEDIEKLMVYNTSQFLAISADYLISYKYFHKYRADVLKLLTFTDEDIAATDKIASKTFKNDTNHKICVHIRRGDFLNSAVHQSSTESFTLKSVLYVREKLLKRGLNTTVVLLGDDRPWATMLFAIYSWAVVPEKTDRPTTDYAFAARHCQTFILTASASTFGFWSAYLSSAENVYYNEKFASSGSQLSNEFNPADVFLPTWTSLRLDDATNTISETPR